MRPDARHRPAAVVSEGVSDERTPTSEAPDPKERRLAYLERIREGRENMPRVTEAEFYRQMERVMGKPVRRIRDRVNAGTATIEPERIATYAHTQAGPVRIANPSPAVLRSLEEQRQRTFTPAGEFRMIAEAREKSEATHQAITQQSCS